jgi:DNA-binding transcriptional LysR family regulator
VAHSDLLTVLPQSFITATGYQDALIYRPLPMPLSPVHVDVLWHLRNEDRSAQRWLRERLIDAVRPPSPDAAAQTPADVSGDATSDNRAP